MKSLQDQKRIEKVIAERYTEYSNQHPHLNYPQLERECHIGYLLESVKHIPKSLESLDANIPWICYWIVHSLDMLKFSLSSSNRKSIWDALNDCWSSESGGFCGSPFTIPHLASTYAAVCAIAILGEEEFYSIIDKEKLYKFLMNMKGVGGTFVMHQDGEMDIRATYCAVSVASLCGLLTDELIEGIPQFVASCQTYEGGIGPQPFVEAHGGFTYCGLATLCILQQESVLDCEKLIAWAIDRQVLPLEGGFQGRTNKLIDGCYSFWIGALFDLLRKEKDGPLVAFGRSNLLSLQQYILACCQEPTGSGGLLDKPGECEDLYHTCYCLSGLAISQRLMISTCADEELSCEFQLENISPIYNISITALTSMRRRFCA